MIAFNPGDIIVSRLIFVSARGTLDITNNFINASIWESIYTPGIGCEIKIVDPNDYISNLQISGDEKIYFSFEAPGADKRNYTFNLNSIKDVTNAESLKAREYIFQGISEEVFLSKSNYIQKEYNTQISNIIIDIFTNQLGSNKQIQIEPTEGTQRIIVNSEKPFSAIHRLRKRATSAENKSSAFLFFENAEGFHFKTLESLFKGSTQKMFKQDSTVGSDFFNSETHNNILAYRADRIMSSSSKISGGSFNQGVSTFNLETLQYQRREVRPRETDYTFGGSGDSSSLQFRQQNQERIGRFSFIPTDSRLPPTNIPERTPDVNAYLATAGQGWVEIRVPGDSNLMCGKNVILNLLAKNQSTETIKLDPLLSGKYLVSALRHYIDIPKSRPRYTCILECIKGNFEKGIS